MLPRLLLLNQRIILAPLLAGFLAATSSQAIADSAWGAAILGGLQGAGEAAADIAKREREAEKEKELIRYRYQLELEREQRRTQEERQRQQDELRRQQEEKQKAEKARQEKEANSLSTGTGFFITTDGYFVTNYHVIKNAKSIVLYTTNGEKIQANLVRADTVNDLAVLKADGRFPVLPVASSRTAKRGQSVATVGYPHADVQGVEPKVTEGIISSLSGIADDPRMFQISVPIQSGNSGGPLITREGNVIGIVVSKLSAAAMLRETGDVTQNVNYAIKSNYLIELLEAAELKLDLPQILKKVRSLEEITAVVERATALVVASPKPFADARGSTTNTPYSKEEQSDRGVDGCPSCPAMVRIPGKNYELGKYEVTQKEWRDIMGSNPSKFSSCGDRCPVEQVNWNDIQKFLQKLNAKTGRQYRLPSEAEWEYACYGGSQSEYCGGNDLNAVAWTDANSNGTTHPAGQKQANGYGLYDMSGNVWEWMQDKYDNKLDRRVLRGGSWSSEPQYERAAYSGMIGLARRDSYFGFRLARTLP